MNKRLSFLPTTIIFIIISILAIAFLSWMMSTLDLPDWAMGIGTFLFWTFIFEIPARLGPRTFETPFSWWQKLPVRNKTIVAISYITFIFAIAGILKH
jgi:hypothetical protein